MDENITIEFVKEWIDKHNLTKGSFDRIMNDLIYNSGHNYIDNPSLRYWLIDNTYKFRDMLPVELNPNQQVVLELLQKAYAKNKWMTPFGAVFSVANENDFAIRAWLTKEEQFQVLAAFAEWGNKSNE